LDERKRRIGANEGIFRSVNELARPLDRTWMTILCECGALGCRDQVVIAREGYTRVREDPTLFVLRPGHETDETERVVGKHIEFRVVRRNPGLSAKVAHETAN
jgi:hypothetical protein